MAALRRYVLSGGRDGVEIELGDSDSVSPSIRLATKDRMGIWGRRVDLRLASSLSLINVREESQTR